MQLGTRSTQEAEWRETSDAEPASAELLHDVGERSRPVITEFGHSDAHRLN